MRCNNCGFHNPKGTLRCDRCNYPIKGSLNKNDPSFTPKDEGQTPEEELKGTVPGAKANAEAWDADNQKPLSDQSQPDANSSKPNRNNSNTPASDKSSKDEALDHPPKENDFQGSKTQTPGKGTIDPTRQGSGIRLLRIPREGEDPKKLAFQKNKVFLNRENTDPDNNTITSKVQAVLEKKNGEWYLSDQSSLQTTYLRVAGEVKVKKGDVILLGNRAFEVDL